MNTKLKELCKEYLNLQGKIYLCESFVSSDVAKVAANFYTLGSAQRAMYGVMFKIAAAGYVQMNQLEELIEEYKNECKGQGTDPTVGIAVS